MTLPMDPELAGLCEAIEVADGGERLRPGSIRDGRMTAAAVARAYRYPAIPITCREGDETIPDGHHTPSDSPDLVDPEAIDRAATFAVEVVRLLDRDLGRAAGDGGAGPSPAAVPAATSAG